MVLLYIGSKYRYLPVFAAREQFEVGAHGTTVSACVTGYDAGRRGHQQSLPLSFTILILEPGKVSFSQNRKLFSILMAFTLPVH